jgi:hypothetical protein
MIEHSTNGGKLFSINVKPNVTVNQNIYLPGTD